MTLAVGVVGEKLGGFLLTRHKRQIKIKIELGVSHTIARIQFSEIELHCNLVAR
jgi:hypothetical protein